MNSAFRPRAFWSVGALAFLLGSTGDLAAQGRFGPQPIQPFNPQPARPMVSPYLNLLRPGGSAAFNYFTLVRPEMEFQRSLSTLQNQVLQNQQGITALSQSGSNTTIDLPATANVPTFLNTGGYFSGGAVRGGNTVGGGNRGGGGLGASGGISAGGLGGGGNRTPPRR